MSGLCVLVVGSGAREHALAWRLASETGVGRVIVAPGNPLMELVATVRPDVSTTDHAGIVGLARDEAVDLVVVGPEAPLVDGLADALAAAGVRCFGPSATASRIEGSKAFAREVCRAAGVAMAGGSAFVDARPAIEYAEGLGLPVVVKADGLAAGKGVTICESLAQAERTIRETLDGRRFGEAGRTVVVERMLEGREASVIALCDGTHAQLLPAARDHKRLGDGDSGPNTGGMGAYSPIEDLDAAALAGMAANLFEPILAELAAQGTPFKGALFAGLMLTKDGPRVLEFNCRLGDPETQAILPRLAVPLTPLLVAAADGALGESGVLAADDAGAVSLTLAADGYPLTPRAGDAIEGIAEARAEGALVFGAGVGRDADGTLTTSGGRVLSVVGTGPDLAAAAGVAYAAAERITFAGKQLRRDIGRREMVAA